MPIVQAGFGCAGTCDVRRDCTNAICIDVHESGKDAEIGALGKENADPAWRLARVESLVEKIAAAGGNNP